MTSLCVILHRPVVQETSVIQRLQTVSWMDLAILRPTIKVMEHKKLLWKWLIAVDYKIRHVVLNGAACAAGWAVIGHHGDNCWPMQAIKNYLKQSSITILLVYDKFRTQFFQPWMEKSR